MRYGARIAWVASVACAVLGCETSGPSPEEQKAKDEKRDRELRAEIDRTLAPYQAATEAFLGATSSSDFDAAYDLLAPSYTNMVTRESFVSRVKTNKNFQKKVEVKILSTSAQAGTTRARTVLGDLGLAEIDFATSGGKPKISSIRIGGMQALPGAP